MKLPPSVKQLLAQRQPNPRHAPSRAALFSIFDKGRTFARAHGAERGWLVLSVSILTISPNLVNCFTLLVDRRRPC